MIVSILLMIIILCLLYCLDIFGEIKWVALGWVDVCLGLWCWAGGDVYGGRHVFAIIINAKPIKTNSKKSCPQSKQATALNLKIASKSPQSLVRVGGQALV